MLILFVLLGGCVLQNALAQTSESCTTQLSFTPAFVDVNLTKTLRITCQAPTLLRLDQFRDAVMSVQKETRSGFVTMATLDFNGNVTKHVKNINVRGLYPTSFEVIIKNPGCDDVTRYACYVNNTQCLSSRNTVQLQRQGRTIAEINGPPSLKIRPNRETFTVGTEVRIVCSTAFFAMRRMISWSWQHPKGKQLGLFTTFSRERSKFGCNETSIVTLKLEADDDGVEIICVAGTDPPYQAQLTLRVEDQCYSIPVFALPLVGIASVLVALGVFAGLLLLGGTKFKFPTLKTCKKKDHIYEIPIRDSPDGVESRYDSLAAPETTYINAGCCPESEYEDVTNASRETNV